MASVRETSDGRGTAVSLGVLVVYVTYWCVRVALKQAHGPYGDWGIFYETGRAFLERSTLYDLDDGSLLTFKYSPFAAMAMMWIGVLPVTVGRVLWMLADAVLLASVVAMTLRLADVRIARNLLWLPITLAVVATANYQVDEFHAGQVGGAMLFLVTLAFVLLWSDRPLTSGAVLAVAINVKLLPLCFVPFYLLRRRWTRGLVSLAATSGLLLLLPALWAGWARNLDLLAQWPRHLFAANDVTVTVRSLNLSVYSILARLFGGYGAGGGLATLPLETIRAIWLGLAIVTAGLIYAWCWCALREPARYTGIRCLSVLLIFMTVFNPNAWRFSFIALIVPLVVLIASYWERPARPWLQNALFAVGLALQFTPGESAEWLPLVLLQDYGGRTVGAILILLAFLIATGGLRPAAREILAR